MSQISPQLTISHDDKFRDQEEQTTRSRAGLLGLNYVDIRGNLNEDAVVPGVIDVGDMYAGKIVPLQRSSHDRPLIFGITSATPQSLLATYKTRFNSDNVQFVMISNQAFRDYMKLIDPPVVVQYDDVSIASEGDSETVAAVSHTLAQVKADDILTYLIEQADRLHASDIHVECQSDDVRIRMRVDGALHIVATIDSVKYRGLQASIASMANISTVSTDAQTGHIRHTYTVGDEQKIVNLRIETVPTVFGQDAVLRLFTFDESLLQLDQLGLNDQQRTTIDDVISHPHGLVMVVGPTGSGKSTTLYSILNALNQPSRKLLTLEDPVEYSIPGVSQIPVNTRDGDSFAEKLKAVLRLDPDVLMVGEIRDVDTARTAVQSAATGHLVLTTFHADDAATALARMHDMIGNNPIFNSAIKLVIAQRLVRQLDENKIPYEADEATSAWIRESMNDLPDGVQIPDLSGAIKLYKPVITQDSPFGYKGRVSLIEQLILTPTLQAAISSKGDESGDATAINRLARENGMVTMLQDGILKALAGVTTIDEINRVL